MAMVGEAKVDRVVSLGLWWGFAVFVLVWETVLDREKLQLDGEGGDVGEFVESDRTVIVLVIIGR